MVKGIALNCACLILSDTEFHNKSTEEAALALHGGLLWVHFEIIPSVLTFPVLYPTAYVYVTQF